MCVSSQALLFLAGRNGEVLCLAYNCTGQLMHVLLVPGQQENGASRVYGFFSYLWKESLDILLKDGSGVRLPELLCLISVCCLLTF